MLLSSDFNETSQIIYGSCGQPCLKYVFLFSSLFYASTLVLQPRWVFLRPFFCLSDLSVPFVVFIQPCRFGKVLTVILRWRDFWWSNIMVTVTTSNIFLFFKTKCFLSTQSSNFSLGWTNLSALDQYSRQLNQYLLLRHQCCVRSGG